MRYKHIFAAVISVALMASGLPVEAKLGGGSSSSSSSSSSSRSSSSYSSSASSRVGGGNSGGMSRSDVMSQVRSQPAPAPARTVTTPAPAYAPVNRSQQYSAPAPVAPAPVQNRGYSGGQLAGAAAAAGVAGYVLGHSNSNPTPVYNQGYPAPGYSGGAVQAPSTYNGGFAQESAPMQAAPVVIQQVPVQSSGMGGFGIFMLLLLLLGGAYFVYRRMTASTSADSMMSYHSMSPSTTSTESQDDKAERELLATAPTLFRELQEANNAGDKAKLERLVDAAFLPTLVHDIDTRTAASQTRVITLKIVNNEILGFEKGDNCYVGSVRFNGLLAEGNAPAENIDEVWHFIRNMPGDRWMLAGIEQV